MTDYRKNKIIVDSQESSDYFVSASDNNNANKKNVVIIVSDALRYDMIGPGKKQSPFVSDMVAKGEMVFFDNSFSPCPSSTCGILGLLSSKRYGDLTVKSLKIYEVLKQYGYHIKFYLSGIHDDWISGLKALYGTNIDETYTNKPKGTIWVDDAVTVAQFNETITDRGEPFFAYVHLMSTHLIGVKHKAVFTPALQNPNPLNYVFGMYPENEVRNNYKNGVYQLDTYLKEMFLALENKGALENTIVIVTGAHGDGLGEKGVYSHSSFLSNYQLRVPILVYGIKRKLYHHAHISSLDVPATLLDYLNIPAPNSWQGTSLLKKQTEEKCSYHEMEYLSAHHLALICSYPKEDAIYKYSVNIMGVKQLYNLKVDPEEKHNLLGLTEYNKIENEMKGALKKYIDKTTVR